MDEEKNRDLEHDPIDGTFTLQLSDNLSDATLTVVPPYFGGKAVTEEDIRKELSRLGVAYGIDEQEIRMILNQERFNSPYRIASWLPPENGVDGTVTFHFDKKVENIPKEDEKGFVNYKDLGYIRNIRLGTVIADITLPTDGTPGINVKNIPVAQKKGVPAPLTYGENIGLSGDGLRLLALCDGNLRTLSGRFSIEKVFNLKGDVDSSIGNLDFIGDIIIRGEVREGFKVVSQKSITIFENVVNATIEAGGDVIIKKGCINSTIVSHGNVSVGFVESSHITCDGDLKADTFVSSNVYCGGELTASGSIGQIMGGKYTCLKNLTANSIGAKSYLQTLITVGDNAVMMEEKAECHKQIVEVEQQIIRCRQIIDFLTDKKKQLGSLPPERTDMLNAAIKQKLVSQMEKPKIQARIAEIDKYLENKQNLSITVKKDLYPGTKITINDFVMQVNDKYQYCRIYLGEDGIATETL